MNVKHAFSHLQLIIVASVICSGCGRDPNAPLTREEAIIQINQHLAQRPITSLKLTREGKLLALQDGLLAKPPGFARDLRTTQKVEAVSGGLLKQGTDLPSVILASDSHKRTNEGLRTTAPIHVSVEQIKGIALINQNYCEVSFVTRYKLPPSANDLIKYIYVGAHEKLLFQRFDDGWRVSQQ